MKIQRNYQDLSNFIHPGKVLLIFGPRQVGKTTLMNEFLKTTTFKFKSVTGDDFGIHKVLSGQNLQELKQFCEGYELLAIDEAQKIPQIGATMKLIVDQMPEIRIIATGSSSFELAGQTGEPLTGRKTTLMLHCISQMELLHHFNSFELKEKLNEFLIYGAYPAVVTAGTFAEKAAILNEISGAYLFKDIFAFERLRNPQLLLDLLRLLAYQIGKEVSVNELSMNLSIDNKTVKRYLELLEKAFIITSLSGYSGNLRKEISKQSKYYFYDIGIRNAVIANFNPPDLRNDKGQLWENFLVIERLKKQCYKPIYSNNFFWRSWSNKEVDFVEEREGKLFGYEFTFSKDQAKVPALWLESYSQASFEVINRDNFLDFVS
jgi:predicted AAA+ superfamily ATPase